MQVALNYFILYCLLCWLGHCSLAGTEESHLGESYPEELFPSYRTSFTLPLVSPGQVHHALRCLNGYTASCSSSQQLSAVSAVQGKFPIHANFLGLLSETSLQKAFRSLDYSLIKNNDPFNQSGSESGAQWLSCLAGCPHTALHTKHILLATSSFLREQGASHNLDRLTTRLMLALQSLGHCVRFLSLRSGISSGVPTLEKQIDSSYFGGPQISICSVILPNPIEASPTSVGYMADHLQGWSVIVNDASLEPSTRAFLLALGRGQVFSVFNNQQVPLFSTTQLQIKRIISLSQFEARTAWSSLTGSAQVQPRSVLEQVVVGQVSVIPSCIQLLTESGLHAAAAKIIRHRKQFLDGNTRSTDGVFSFILPHNEGKLHFSMTPALAAIALAALASQQTPSCIFRIWMHSGGSFARWLQELGSVLQHWLKGGCPACAATRCCSALGRLGFLLRHKPQHCCQVHHLMTRMSIDRLIEAVSGMFVWTAHLPHAEYFAALQQGSLYLDSHPVGGGTTSMDALFLGVPVLTMPSSIDAGRLSTAHYLTMKFRAATPNWPKPITIASLGLKRIARLSLQELHLVAACWEEYISHALWHLAHPELSAIIGRVLATKAEVLFNDSSAAQAWSDLTQQSN